MTYSTEQIFWQVLKVSSLGKQYLIFLNNGSNLSKEGGVCAIQNGLLSRKEGQIMHLQGGNEFF